MKIPTLTLLVINCAVVLSRNIEQSDLYTFCSGLCNSISETKDNNKVLMCQRKCHDKMIEEGLADGHTKKLPRKQFKRRRGVIRRAGKMLFKPLRYVYRKFVPKQDEGYDDRVVETK